MSQLCVNIAEFYFNIMKMFEEALAFSPDFYEKVQPLWKGEVGEASHLLFPFEIASQDNRENMK